MDEKQLTKKELEALVRRIQAFLPGQNIENQVNTLIHEAIQQKNREKALKEIDAFFAAIELEDAQQRETIKALLMAAATNPAEVRVLLKDMESVAATMTTEAESMTITASTAEVELSKHISILQTVLSQAHVQTQLTQLTQLAQQIQTAQQQQSNVVNNAAPIGAPAANPVVTNNSAPVVVPPQSVAQLQQELHMHTENFFAAAHGRTILNSIQHIQKHSENPSLSLLHRQNGLDHIALIKLSLGAVLTCLGQAQLNGGPISFSTADVIQQLKRQVQHMPTQNLHAVLSR